jgi:TonB family protein
MQPFQAFLNDTRKRPLGLRIFGYFVSVGMHGPPVTLFMVSWLTQTLLLGGGAFDLAMPQNETVLYRVPVQLDAFFPGITAPGTGGGSTTGGGSGTGRRGASGPVKRRARRPLIQPEPGKSKLVLAVKPAAVGPEEHVEEDAGHQGPGGNGLGGLSGQGTGLGSGGPGGDGHGPGGLGLLAAREPRTKTRPRPRVKEDTGNDSIEEAFGSDDEQVVGAPLQGRPTRVSMDYAAYLRTYENFPSLPDACWPPGRTTNAVLVEVCVSERGTVNDVVVRQSAGNDTDAFLMQAIRSWRYRPRLVSGSPRPFCHPIRIVYKKELRFDRRW